MKTIYSAVLIAATWFSILTAQAQTNGFLTDGLVAYYPLNGSADDESGNHNDGTISGATWTQGFIGSALHFKGRSRVTVGDSPSLDPKDSITLAAWFRADNWNGNNRIINKGDLQYDLTSEFGYFKFTAIPQREDFGGGALIFKGLIGVERKAGF